MQAGSLFARQLRGNLSRPLSRSPEKLLGLLHRLTLQGREVVAIEFHRDAGLAVAEERLHVLRRDAEGERQAVSGRGVAQVAEGDPRKAGALRLGMLAQLAGFAASSAAGTRRNS